MTVSSFPILSFEQANPFLAGLKYGQGIISQGIQNRYAPQTLQEQLRQLQLGNNLKDVQLQYAPQMSQADLAIKQAQPGLINAQTGETNARIPLYQAQGDLARQQANFYPYVTAGNLDPVTKLIMGRYLAGRVMGNPGGQGIGGGTQGMPSLQSADGGMTVQPGTGAPNQIPAYLLGNQSANPAMGAANLPVLPGGLGAAQGQQVAQQMNMPPGGQMSPQGGMPLGLGGGQGQTGGGANSLYDNLYGIQLKNALNQMTKDPTMGSQKSGAGGTYTDPTTGQQFTTDTSKNTSLDQQTIGAIQRVQPLLKDLTDNLSPFQTLSGQGKLQSEKLGNYLFGMNNKAPSMYATGQSALQTAPESLLKAWGLNVTNESQEAMRKSVQPIFGESAQGYTQRVLHTLMQLQENQRQAKNRLKSGTNLDAAGQQAVPQIQETKPLGGKTYYKINGQWHE